MNQVTHLKKKKPENHLSVVISACTVTCCVAHSQDPIDLGGKGGSRLFFGYFISGEKKSSMGNGLVSSFQTFKIYGQ